MKPLTVVPPRDGDTMKIPAKRFPQHAGAPSSVVDVDVAALERELSRAVSGEVRFDDGTRRLYATDASNYRQVPIGVVIPKSLDDVVVVHEVCHRHGAPILARGCGTSLSGETVNVAVVIDFSKYLTEILDVDPKRKIARVQPGVVHDQLADERKRFGLVFAPDPSTHSYCTLGGNIGNNSCGIHSVQAQFYGPGPRTSDNVERMEIVTYDGLRMWVGPTSDDEFDEIVAQGGRRAEIYERMRALRDRYADLIRKRFPDIPRRVSGYNLDDLLPEKGFNVARALVGTEGTIANVLQADVILTPDPPGRCLVVVGYKDIFCAGDHVAQIMKHEPVGCEGLDHMLIEDQQRLHMHPEELAMLPDGTAYLLVEFGADTQEEADEKARALMAELETVDEPPVDYKIVDDPEAEQRLWEVREAGLGATAFPPDDDRDHWPGWEDSAVPPEAVGSYLRDLKKLYEKYSLRGAMYGHLGQGCIHSRISFDLQTPGGLTTYRSFMEEAADLVVSYGGSLSGEHGDGQQRAELLPRMYGDELVEAFREFKRIWDPDWKMNPGKVVDPYRIDENLKLGAGYNPPRPDTHFSFEEDGFDFAHATLRCVGVGKCRERGNSGTMCPSFQVLHEEKHTTRGRARMLFEMLQGDVVDKGWRDEDVYDALHLCLSCKGCTNECPVNVDIPTLKSEFLSHHFEGRLRPREHYSMGLIMLAGRLGSRIPAVANFFGQMPPFSNLLKWAGGVAQPRQVPVFADHTFRQWFESRETPNPNGKRVILWADTFNSYWKPETAQACVEVLEDAGCRVVIPAKKLCCGRPLFHYGMLDTAKRFMDDILETLRDDIRAGVPVIGAEPSCLAVFREELPKLMPHDNDVQRLKQNSYQFSEFLDELGYEPPKLHRKALVHGHCHHKNGLGGMDAEEKLLKAMELDFEIPDTGCCGMAGAFGFERGDPYDVSVKCGERVLLPAVREATDDMLIVANGFSCKEQIRQETDREALHVAEVIKMAWDHGPGGAPVGRRPEKGYEPSSASALRGGLTVAAAAAAAYGAFKAWRDTAPEPPPKSKVASLLLRRR